MTWLLHVLVYYRNVAIVMDTMGIHQVFFFTYFRAVCCHQTWLRSVQRWLRSVPCWWRIPRGHRWRWRGLWSSRWRFPGWRQRPGSLRRSRRWRRSQISSFWILRWRRCRWRRSAGWLGSSGCWRGRWSICSPGGSTGSWAVGKRKREKRTN